MRGLSSYQLVAQVVAQVVAETAAAGTFASMDPQNNVPAPERAARTDERKSVTKALIVNALGAAALTPGSAAASHASIWPVLLATLAWAALAALACWRIIAAPRLSTRARRWASTAVLLAGLAPTWFVLIHPLVSA